jgi:mannose-6-phosphate isomerase-like protein (cupin superfamily)
MPEADAQQLDRLLLKAMSGFVLRHDNPAVAGFKPAIRDWGDTWQDVGEAYLPAAELLTSSLATTSTRTHDLLSLFEQYKHRLFWEQSYRKADGVVSDALLAAYGFAEIIGNHGPFISDRIRCGIAAWGPGIVYPRHQHDAEEIYMLLAGSAEYSVGDTTESYHGAGDVVFVKSMTIHGFRTTDKALVVCYLWQAGDLREISSFV